MDKINHMLILGIGQVGASLIRLADPTTKITGATRNPLRLFEFVELGITPLIMPLPSAEIIEPLARNAWVVVTFPPGTESDAVLAPACRLARRLIYVSSTGVYGRQSGTIDDTTAVAMDDSNTQRIAAEEYWRHSGAIILRAPGIYGPQSGLHIRLKQGTYRLPGDGKLMSSRIHVDDLARTIFALLEKEKTRQNTYVIGDKNPCSQLEVVTWLCREMKLPLPESVALTDVNSTMKSNRSVDSSGLLQELQLSLLYPSYEDGYAQCLAKMESQPEVS